MSTKGPLGFDLPSAAVDERLDFLIEECAEVIQAAVKCKRFGMDSHHPNGGPTNREALQNELGHVDAAMILMFATEDLSIGPIQISSEHKGRELAKWLVRQQKQGTDQ